MALSNSINKSSINKELVLPYSKMPQKFTLAILCLVVIVLNDKLKINVPLSVLEVLGWSISVFMGGQVYQNVSRYRTWAKETRRMHEKAEPPEDEPDELPPPANLQ